MLAEQMRTADSASVSDDADSVQVGAVTEPAPWWDEHTRLAERPILRLVEQAAGVGSDRDDDGDDARRAAGSGADEGVRTTQRTVPAPTRFVMPGRHAARRPGESAGAAAWGLLPDTLRGRLAFGPAQVAVVALVVSLGLAVTTWIVVRSDAAPIEGPGTVALTRAPAGTVLDSDAAPTAPQESAPAGTGVEATVTVDVAGEVQKPGIVVLDAGARVIDAVDAAGGARRGVETTSINLARVLVDGEQIVVGGPASGGGSATGGPQPAVPGAGPLVDLNLATSVELEALPEVGPVTAAAIIAWREEHGGFSAVQELLEVSGIGEKTLAMIAPHVTV